MCRALAARGISCDLVATNDNGPGLLDVTAGEWTMRDGVRVLFFSRVGNLFPPLREFQVGSGFAAWIGEHVRDYDVIHVHALFSYMSSTAMRAAGRASVPYVLRPLGLLEHYSLLGVEIPDEPAHGSKPRTSGVPQIIFLSRWHAKKRIGVLIEALARMKDRPWHLVLAGTGDSKIVNEVRESVRANGLINRVSMPGFLEGDAKWAALREADIFVLPSASENFGIAVAAIFPLLFLSTGIPWPTAFEYPVTTGLMNGIASFLSEILPFAGIPARREGTMIVLLNCTVGIEEACSGIRSLQSAFMIALAAGEIFRC